MTNKRAAPLRQDSRVRAFNLPQGAGARLFAASASRSIKPAFVAQVDHFLDEKLFLLVIEAHVERLGRVGDAALIDGAVVEELSLVAHLLDDIVGGVAVGAGE